VAKILVVDDHPLFRAGLKAMLDLEADLDVIAEVATLGEAIQAIADTPIDLAIVDILLAGDHDGGSVTRTLRERMPAARVLGLSVLDEPIRVAEFMRSGAASFANKTQSVPEIVGAIRTTLRGDRYVYPPLADALEPLMRDGAKLPLDVLTAREREVYDLLVQGLSNEEAGTKLGIAPRTVETHRQHIMKKLDVHSIAELVRLAAKCGTLN
jgi:DNA-binding NarL/FixJ family response regulator